MLPTTASTTLVSIMFKAFLARTEPAQSMAKPSCITKTRQHSRSASVNVYLQLAFLFLKPIQSVAFDMATMTVPIPQHNSASEGRSHCNNCRLISSSFKSSLPCFQESLDCILCILVGLTHCQGLTDIWPIQSVAFDMATMTVPIPQHNSASEGRSHCNNCRLISSSFKSSLPCFQESLDCILCILVGLTHCQGLTDIWVGI
ncbi:hypothetical protein CFP56_004315 [Quercus suber]|uniref:Uncharacterized protein n=1 Tax=Quercus suber TaxID=58331 RepID=A0AAW0IH43_QUESU